MTLNLSPSNQPGAEWGSLASAGPLGCCHGHGHVWVRHCLNALCPELGVDTGPNQTSQQPRQNWTSLSPRWKQIHLFWLHSQEGGRGSRNQFRAGCRAALSPITCLGYWLHAHLLRLKLFLSLSKLLTATSPPASCSSCSPTQCEQLVPNQPSPVGMDSKERSGAAGLAGALWVLYRWRQLLEAGNEKEIAVKFQELRTNMELGIRMNKHRAVGHPSFLAEVPKQADPIFQMAWKQAAGSSSPQPCSPPCSPIQFYTHAYTLHPPIWLYTLCFTDKERFPRDSHPSRFQVSCLTQTQFKIPIIPALQTLWSLLRRSKLLHSVLPTRSGIN